MMKEVLSTSDEIKRLRAKVNALEHRVRVAEAAARAATVSRDVALAWLQIPGEGSGSSV